MTTATAKLEALQTEAREIVATGICPDCGAKLRRNLSITGWWQCEQYGAPNFRKIGTNAACDFQCFTS